MTTNRRDGNDSPFSDWVRNHRGLDSSEQQAALSISDVDYVVHKYLTRCNTTGRVLAQTHMMLIELKTRGGRISESQRDTLRILNRALEEANHKRIQTRRGLKTFIYHGLHLLRLSGKTPDDSKIIWWDGSVITSDTHVQLLRFERRPRDPAVSLVHRSHHVAQQALDENWLAYESNRAEPEGA